MIARFDYPEQLADFEVFVAQNPGCIIWDDGGVMRVCTGSDIPQQPVPEAVTPWQIRKAINATPGLRAQIEALLASPETPLDVKDGWVVATEWRRDDPVLLAMATQLGMDDAEIDALFRLAATLAAGTGIALEQAQYILSQADVSEDQPESELERLGLVLLSDESIL